MDQGEPRGRELRVGLVGADQAGTAFLQLFASVPAVRVVAVADPNPGAPWLSLARARGIPVTGSPSEIFSYQPEVVIEVTGRADMREALAGAKPNGVELIGVQSVWLFRELLALRTREAQRFEKAETIRRMTAGVYHSLSNLFTTLVARSSFLLQSMERIRDAPPRLSEELQTLVRTVTRGTEVLHRLRGLMQESTEQPVTRIDANGLVREAVALTDPLVREAQRHATTIDVRSELGEVPAVVGRPSELLEVLVNLIVNAIEAMPKGGVLTLETGAEGGHVLLRVRDTGLGIPDAVKAQLFTPFFTTKVAGTGLGLSVSREILRHHGGDLALESGEGRGTCVTIRLPAAGIHPGEKRVTLSDFGKVRVLIVDDDPLLRDVLIELFTSEGCQVRSAAGGEEALNWLKRESYDVVLADVVMPRIMGWEVARAARAQEPAPAVILFSGCGFGPEDPAIRASGADAFLRLPFQVPELVKAVQGVLNHRARLTA
jgi:signal transduction histidine kinase